ncbi:Oligoxyloglucan reducing end-specific cellobiohydrolase [Choiromyces venosus 120613-1]|uniref:Oligoxyloglucan reducing end-specific cellobiohydrolase n=1 Tax=Choiromyces venosus 120613-1 TaxID=1336337 RepID=A0A3N4J6H9_9PEZI|nr:Oligoxyloglucan reducing end-specific cellobiohydrolase [Choiromyces venosus 120613-1]
MYGLSSLIPLLSAASTLISLPIASAVSTQCYNWKNVRIGGGGGFIPNIVFNPGKKGLAYARSDIGGAYRLNSDDSWTALQDSVTGDNWGDWGVDAIATDPVEVSRLYLLTGMYTNSMDPNSAHILRSLDYGGTFERITLPFKAGGNMPGRGMGERLAIDPNKGSILFLGARSGNGLWKSTDYGSTWAKVSSFTKVGTYIPDPSDTSGINGDIIGISWITFDQSSASRGTATPKIYVGVADKTGNSVFVTTNGGTSWTAVSGQPTGYIPHKGGIDQSKKIMYVTYTDGAGPYDGTSGYIYRYDMTSGAWTNISPSSGTFGFGGVSVDVQKPGTVMVATLNQWWPDATIWRSLDSGNTWSPLWELTNYPNINLYFKYDVTAAPWLYDPASTNESRKLVGWMIEGLCIDPFDSNHFLYGTGATVYGSRDLLSWDSVHNITLESMATGIEETSIQALISPPSGPKLISAVGDITGYVHNNLDSAPTLGFTNPYWPTTLDLDYAGNKPANVVRVGSDSSGSTKQIAVSTNSGVSWTPHTGAPDGTSGGNVALSADGTTILWRTGGGSVSVSAGTNTAFTASSGVPSGAVIASDKKDNTIFYAASGTSFYISRDAGISFTKSSPYHTDSSSPVRIVANVRKSGDVWVSADTGLFHSTDFGHTFTKIANVDRGYHFALGAPKTSAGYPAVFMVGTVSGTAGIWRSDDSCVSWIKIDDAAHGFGAPNSIPVAADWNTYGRVYLGTNGRGIFYGDVSCATPTT